MTGDATLKENVDQRMSQLGPMERELVGCSFSVAINAYLGKINSVLYKNDI